MPILQGAKNTTANNSKFTDVAGDHISSDVLRNYGGDEKPQYQGGRYRGNFQGVIGPGGQGTHNYGIQPNQISSTSYPSLSAEGNSLLEAELAVTHAKHDLRKEKARADSLEAELARVKAELAALKERVATLTRRRN